MLSAEDNALIGEVGPGTAMGELLRRFWVPFLEAARVERPACDPVEVELLGERLIAYRDGDGRCALIESACPHRGAPLYYGRNEGDGLRCIYHGWKFAADGRCVEMPSEPAKSNFKEKVRARSYEVREKAGILWAYMGPPETTPGLPHIEWANIPASRRNVVAYNQECNWVQALEGDIDSSHVGFLHRGALARESAASRQDNELLLHDTSPRWVVEMTDYGMMLAAQRSTKDPAHDYWRVNQWLMPYVTMIPTDLQLRRAHGHVWTPVNDGRTRVWCVIWSPTEDLPQEERDNVLHGPMPHIATLDEATGRLRAAKENHFLQDRYRQRNTDLLSGIVGVREQDTAVVEGMGALADRTREHLGTSDIPIITMRRRLLRDAKALREGVEPIAASTGEHFGVRSWSALLDSGAPFRDNPRVPELMAAMA